jgi:hypothetical protein
MVVHVVHSEFVEKVTEEGGTFPSRDVGVDCVLHDLLEKQTPGFLLLVCPL